jgi:hypothetical protein
MLLPHTPPPRKSLLWPTSNTKLLHPFFSRQRAQRPHLLHHLLTGVGDDPLCGGGLGGGGVSSIVGGWGGRWGGEEGGEELSLQRMLRDTSWGLASVTFSGTIPR